MIKVSLNGITNAGPTQTAIAHQAAGLLEGALNHPSFERIVLTASYRKTRFRDGSGRSFSVSPGGVYELIASGTERNTEADTEIDLEVRLRKLRRGIVGSTRLGRLPFATAYWFINGCIRRNDPVSLASHFMHEWLHVCGFHHHPNNGAREDVPYVVAGIVREILKAQPYALVAEAAEGLAVEGGMAALAWGLPADSASTYASPLQLAPMEMALVQSGCGADADERDVEVGPPSDEDQQ